MPTPTRYGLIIERIFLSKYKRGARQIDFEREDIARAAGDLSIGLPKNLGDVVYSFRYRAEFPESIQSRTPKGKAWIIRPDLPPKTSPIIIAVLPGLAA